MGDSKGWMSAGSDTKVPGPALTVLPHAIGPVIKTAPRSWPPGRVAAVEALWGNGYTTPGGGPETLRLVKPLGLDSSMAVLVLGGGLGGPAQTLSSNFGAWVASFEADPDLRNHAISRAKQDPHGRITIVGWDRARPSFSAHSVNHALSLEALRGNRPMPLLQSLAAALYPQGQIVLTELVSDEAPSIADREFAAWCRLDDRLPQLPRSNELTEGLQRLGFEIRVVEDLSERHITQTLGGWREAVRAIAAGPRPGTHSAASLVNEAELWLLRIRLMRRLGVRLMRWHAVGPGAVP